MTASRVTPVILSGGAGTRLWPLSRETYPKQLQRLLSERTLLQDTVLRLAQGPGLDPPLIVCNEEHRFIIAEQMREIGAEGRLVVEPAGRNTAPAACIAALMAEDPQALLLVMPSDNQVSEPTAFHDALAAALPLARAGRLVTFGIAPERPESGYGYIRRGAPLDGGAFAVEAFVEKPDEAVAEGFLAAGGHLWNSGIFLFSAGAFLGELGRFHPEIVAGCRRALAEGGRDLFFLRLGRCFEALPARSIDHAVMERTRLAAVLPVSMGWSDVGSWSALFEASPRDGANNAVLGRAVARDTADCYLRSDGPLVAAFGVSGLAVVATEDAVLVADRARAQDLRGLVDGLKAEGRREATQSVRVHRPWGWFRTIETAERFQVKHIQVNAGASLSLQKHQHRSEHWVVVRGVAEVTCGERTFLLHENQSAFIPVGVVHRLANPGPEPLSLIEVQSGSYLGEDDIIRLDDSYGRSG